MTYLRESKGDTSAETLVCVLRNVSLLMVGDKLTSFIAFVSFRNVNIFRRHYLLESAAALAADVAKAISQASNHCPFSNILSERIPAV